MSTSQNKNKKNIFYMNLAFNQAKINLGNTKKNPSVGCIIAKNNSVISAGFTYFNGRPHAESIAINSSRQKVIGSNLYVTLEPCSHYGKTAPCVRKIIKHKIKKVFFSINDPDSRSFNKSSRIFRKSKIKFNKGILSYKAKEFYKSYISYKNKELPFVTSKLAVSKDFFTINKRKKWITNLYSRGRVHLMRSNHDTIITSSKTVNVDNPILNCRINGLEMMSPSRIILDNYLKISLNSNIIRDSSKYRTIIFYNKDNNKKIEILKKKGVQTYKIPVNTNGNLDLKKVLLKAKKLGFSRIFLESGIKLTTNFLKENLINEIKIFISNKKLKMAGKGSIKKYFKTFFKNKKYELEKVYLFGEKLISYKIK